ncbi:MAG: TolC family protein [Pirellulaceae bacterium]|nr:TolC family protein [Pirellulaceae bacterium]
MRTTLTMRTALCLLFLWVMATVWLGSGCTRTRYRTAADRDAYRLVQEKSAGLSEQVPGDYTVRPDTRSRFYDATNPDCPQLPTPRPVLRGYELPALASDTPCPDPSAPLMVTDVGPYEATPGVAINTPLENNSASNPGEGNPVNSVPIELIPPVPTVWTSDIPSEQPMPQLPTAVIPASYSGQPIVLVQEPVVPAESAKQPNNTLPNAADNQSVPGPPGPAPARSNNSMVNKVTVPEKAWEVLPQTCLERMLEFPSLREEYAQTFTGTQFDSANDQTRRLTLANLMELATINSREYQARKEILFRAALALSRQRYQFELNPTQFGNGTAANYRHLRNGGITQNTLAVPTGVGVEQTLATGGEFLARFANSVVLTFNGPSGFATDIGSELVFDFQQTIFQRDIRFEILTQTERDVVYATRDYLRFRKQLFRDIANQYYNLLVSYRGIEINAQDYFTNLRGFLQSQAEYRTAEKIPRIQVDQFEQNVLRTRSNLVNNCFALEAALDQLKFRLGLPTEMVIHINLNELESISLKDELSVARQMITRARAELINTRNAAAMDATTLANVAEVLADRMANILRIQSRMDAIDQADRGTQSPADKPSAEAIAQATRELDELQHLLKILGVRMQVDMLRAELDAEVRAATQAPALRLLIRAVDLTNAELQVIDLALDGPQLTDDAAQRAVFIKRRDEVIASLATLMDFMNELSSNIGSVVDVNSLSLFDQIPQRMKASVELADKVKALASDATQGMLPTGNQALAAKVQATVDKTIELSDKLLEKGPDGWEEIVLDQDEALLTGLVQRLDLMNQRGDLADAWRQIKLAGDDLRSIVNLQATQILRTNSKENDPFDFTFDDSETRLGVALDTPLNRRLQRNNFRLALINYNVGLRNLMAAEDSIKLDIREDLRQLALDRNQYTIAVASAALAYERVISTRLRLQLAVQNVAARDFLESQQAYTNALSAIARQHVNYITDRIELFFDLEAFDVDRCGHWSGVSGDYAPQINVDFPTTNPRPYDTLPPRVRYSPDIRQMERIAPGNAVVK